MRSQGKDTVAEPPPRLTLVSCLILTSFLGICIFSKLGMIPYKYHKPSLVTALRTEAVSSGLQRAVKIHFPGPRMVLNVESWSAKVLWGNSKESSLGILAELSVFTRGQLLL